tara:strand:+ start:318 stop:740 length:423 start_codon:yes stop_codon:yes gene_type:complete
MKKLLNKINKIVPKELIVLDLIEDKSKIKIVVDSAKSVDLHTTTYLAKKIRKSELLDALYPDGYQLEVSSPGIDAPLMHPIQFEKNIGRDLLINELSNPNGIIVKLTDASETGFDAISENGDQISYNYDQIKSAIVKVKF